MVFAIGSLGFWILLVALSAIVVAAMQFEKVIIATAGLVGAFTAMALWGDFNILAAIWAHPLIVVAVIAGYFVCGAAWAPTKWRFHVKECRYKYNDTKADFLRDKGIESGSKIPDELLDEWKRYYRTGIQSKTPQARDNKSRILSWMTYWPWSLGWTLLNDPIRKLFRQIYRQMQSFLQGIADKAYAGVADDFREVPEPPKSDGEASDPPDGDDDELEPEEVLAEGSAGTS